MLLFLPTLWFTLLILTSKLLISFTLCMTSSPEFLTHDRSNEADVESLITEYIRGHADLEKNALPYSCGELLGVDRMGPGIHFWMGVDGNSGILRKFLLGPSSSGGGDINCDETIDDVGVLRMLVVMYFCLFVGGVMNLAGTPGEVSVIFRGLPAPDIFQSFFVITISILLSSSCGFSILPRDSNSGIKTFYVSVADAAAAIVLVCAFSSLAYLLYK